MIIKYHYSHMNGYEYLMSHSPDLWDEIKTVLKKIEPSNLKPKISKEKLKKGEELISPIEIKNMFDKLMKKQKWQKKIKKYMVSANQEFNEILKNESFLVQKKMSIQKKEIKTYVSSNAINHLKNDISINLQLGKYSFVHFDIFNHISNYFSGEIKLGIILVPTKKMSQHMSTGISFYEKNLHEIQRCRGNYPGIPMILGGVE